VDAGSGDKSGSIHIYRCVQSNENNSKTTNHQDILTLINKHSHIT